MKIDERSKLASFPLVMTAALALAFGTSAQCIANGHSGGNGGDPTLSRQRLIRTFVNSELRQEAINYMQTLRPEIIQDAVARNALAAIKNQGSWTEDFRESSYILKESCTNVGGELAGGALLNDFGGDICLSPKRLAEISSSKAEIVALVIHEHAHHYGYVDANYSIYNAVFNTLLLTNPTWRSAPPTSSVPTTTQPLPPNWTDIVRNLDGSIRHMNQNDADSFCRNQGQRLPTARELALFSQNYLGARGVERGQIDESYRLIGGPDFFYYSKEGYRVPSGDLGNSWVWSSTLGPDHPEFAVYFNGSNGDVDYLERNSAAGVVFCVLP